MTDKEMYKILQHFANNHSLAVGGDIEVVMSSHSTEMKPRSEPQCMKYDDANWLHEIIRGATVFMLYLRREGYDLRRKK